MYKFFFIIKIIIKEENFKWHLEAFASELFIYYYATCMVNQMVLRLPSREWLLFVLK